MCTSVRFLNNGDLTLGEIIGALADILGVYLLYALGRFAIFFCTVGYYKAAPYQANSDDEETSGDTNRLVSKKITMLIGFVFLVLMCVTVGIYFAPYKAF